MKLEFRNKWMNKQWGFNAILSFFPNLIFHVVVVVTLNFQWNEMNENKKKSWGSYWDREFFVCLFVHSRFLLLLLLIIILIYFPWIYFFSWLSINRNDVSVDGHSPISYEFIIYSKGYIVFFLVWWNIYHLKWIKRVANSKADFFW